MLSRPRSSGLSVFLSLGLAVLLPSVLSAQPISRLAATSLQLPATPPASTYSTARVFSPLAFTQPVALVTPPGDTRRLFVVEKIGRIWVIPDVTAAAPTRTLFLDLTSHVNASTVAADERGLLALAFHPQYAANGQFFVWYTTTATTAAGAGLHDRLSRFRVSANPNLADLTSEQPLITQRDEADNHNGGELAFGPDGYLYLSVGDEGGGNDQFQNGQRIDRDFFAGILRLDVDRRTGSLPPNPHPAVHAGTYAVPPDNPFIDATTFNGAALNRAALRTEFWAIGLRNPWRIAFDSATGRLWCADVGQGTREEIDLIVRGGNYGWPHREGGIAQPGRPAPPAAAGLVEPIWDYGRADGLSVIGGFVYRGFRYSSLYGRYLFADFGSGRLWALDSEGDRPATAARVQLLATEPGISSFGLDPATGDILLADLLDGTIKRLVATAMPGAAPFPANLSATGVFASMAAFNPAPGVVPYEPVAPAWADHALTRRWFALPTLTGQFSASNDDRWTLPAGAVWVQHFDLEAVRGAPETARRVETRLLVKTAGSIYGLSYRWNSSQSDATLVPDEGAEQVFDIVENGVSRTQTWRFPGRAECLTCHTAAGGHALGFNTRQLNHDDFFLRLISSGYLIVPATLVPVTLPALVNPADATASLEQRARSYLDANCSGCHQPGSLGLGEWDARAATTTPPAHLFDLLGRMSLRGPGQMPPLATHERDLTGESLIRDWLYSHLTGSPSVDPTPSRIVNLAARASLDASSQLITGFVIAPGPAKRLLVRAVGPTLGTAFGVPNAAANPVLTLFSASAGEIARNDDWSDADLPAAFDQAGAFRLPSGSRDAALIAELAPGAYTAQVTASGITLVEVYDLDARPATPDADPQNTPSRLINLAVRTHVGTGENIFIPGLVIGPGAPKTVLLRAVGPGLAPFGVTGTLATPTLTLLSGSQRLLTNTRWSSATNATELRATGTRVGAFALTDADSALLTTLPPGSYTLQVSGANNTTGLALVEVYEVP